MRLIDADALEKEGIQFETHGGATFIALGTVRCAPTIEAEPVKHGEWIYDEIEMEYSCSECGRAAPVGMNGYILSERCHRCGAKMDLEG